jgi:hypothetical protein
MRAKRAANIAVVLLVVLVVGVGASTILVTGDLPLQTNTGFTVTLDNAGTFPGTGSFVGNDTISISTGTVTAAGAGALEIPDSDLSGQTELTNINVSGTTAEIDPDDKPQFDISGELSQIGLETPVAVGDQDVDFSYVSSGNFDLTLRGLTPNADLAVVSPGGALLGSGTSDGSGTATLTMTTTGANDAVLVTNDAPTLSNFDPSGETITTPTPNLTVDVDDTSFSKLGGDEITVEFFDGSDSSSIGTDTLSSAGTASTQFTLTSNGQKSYFVEATDQFGASVTSPTQTFELQEPAPTIADVSPPDGQLLSEGPVVLKANVSDPSLPGGDTLTVEFSDNSGVFDTQTVTSNQSVSATYPQLLGGPNDYSITVSDTFGGSDTTGTNTFSVPANLTLRDANNASNIIDDPNVTATVRFFEEEGNLVFPREPTNGVVDMTGLPVDESFVVGVRDTSGTFVSRLTLIDTIFEQQEVFLVNQTESTAIVRFNLEDRTGRFIAGETEIQILRAINTTDSPPNTEEYVVVAGDVIGSQLSFETELQQDVRYRVRVQNDIGETRELGAFTARLDQVVDLTISGIDVGFDESDDGTQVQTSQTIADNGDKTIQFNLLDLSESTTDISVEVLEEGNESNVIDQGGFVGPAGSYQFTTVVSGAAAEEEYLVRYEYTRDGETITATVVPGASSFSVGSLDQLDPGWAQIFGVGFLIVMAGIFSRANARIGALVLPGIALMLYITGVLDGVLTVASIGVAFAIAVGLNLISSDARAGI